MCLVYRSAFGLNELLCGDCTKLPRPQRACSCRPKARICGRHLAAQSAGFTETAGLPAWENRAPPGHEARSEEHTSELQSLMHTSYYVYCLKTNQIGQSIQPKHNNNR